MNNTIQISEQEIEKLFKSECNRSDNKINQEFLITQAKYNGFWKED